MALGDFVIYSYTGAVQTAELEEGKRYLIECWGGQGAGGEGKGGYAKGILSILEDTDINIYVAGAAVGGTGGWNGGANGHNGAGGASDVRIGGTDLADRIIVAGGGGAAGDYNIYKGGGGGGFEGQPGQRHSADPGTGGTQEAGGSLNGALGVGGAVDGAGGGGGYYGGGGASSNYSGGGGGSSYVGGVEAGETIAAIREGNGQIKITELTTIPTTLTEETRYDFTGAAEILFLAMGKYNFKLYGAQGGNGGLGGYCSADIELGEDKTLMLLVGGEGAPNAGGFNGGGWGGAIGAAAGGGGASDIRIESGNFDGRILVAGGGGGKGNTSYSPGAGGGLEGGDGYGAYTSEGGTQESGHAIGIGGNGQDGNSGGGGGGYYGGGGGLNASCGAGGSSFYGEETNGETESGINEGDGYILITPLNSAPKQRRRAQII